MLLGGLWHGASWTFVVWGGLHGVYLAAERWLVKRLGHHEVWNKLVARILLALLTYFLINITWVFFRARDFATAWRMITTMLTFVTSGEKILPTVLVLQTVITTAVMLAIHWWMRNRRLDEVIDRLPVWLTGLLWGFMLMLIIITQGGSDAFIYFQF
jgi:alginate O-acetyltransferase complex protein AlgI